MLAVSLKPFVAFKSKPFGTNEKRRTYCFRNTKQTALCKMVKRRNGWEPLSSLPLASYFCSAKIALTRSNTVSASALASIFFTSCCSS